MDIQDLIPRVVQGIKTAHQLKPTVYAQFNGQAVISWPIPAFQGNGREKAQTLFKVGREAAKQNRGRDLLESCLVTETWMGEESKLGGVRPINAPADKRIEAVMFLIVKNETPFQPLAHLYSIKRKGGQVSELVFMHTSDQINGLLAQSFTAGARSLEVSDEDIARLPFDPRPFLQ